MSDPTWVSVLPPVVAIALAVSTRHVYLSLGAGIWMGRTILSGWDPLVGLRSSIEVTVGVFADPDSASVLLFTLAIGSLIATLGASGGVRGFLQFVESRGWVDSPKKAQVLAWVIGLVIFIESNITVLVAGAVSRPLFDRYRVSREKLAYLIDSTSAAVCILVPLNAWGAYNLAILGNLGVQDPLAVFVAAIPMNFYALSAILVAGASASWRVDIGPMKRAEERTRDGRTHWPRSQPLIEEEILSAEPSGRAPPRAMNMVIPMLVMIGMMPVGLWITGEGRLSDGVGSTAVLWAVLAAIASAWILAIVQERGWVSWLTRTALKGAGGLVPLALILLLALSLGGVANELGTGVYVAEATAAGFPLPVFLPVVFVVSAAIAFATGTSWGTFAIMLPIVVPAAMTLGHPLSPFVAAALSGGIFGDHASPISDTTIMSSMAAATDHIDHVRTQLPYAIVSAGSAAVAFALLGVML